MMLLKAMLKRTATIKATRMDTRVLMRKESVRTRIVNAWIITLMLVKRTVLHTLMKNSKTMTKTIMVMNTIKILKNGINSNF